MEKVSFVNVRDYKLPNLRLKVDSSEVTLGKLAKAKLEHLKANEGDLYLMMLMKKELDIYLENFEKNAENKVERLIKFMIRKEKVLENLEKSDYEKVMKRFRKMAEKIVMDEIWEEKIDDYENCI